LKNYVQREEVSWSWYVKETEKRKKKELMKNYKHVDKKTKRVEEFLV